MQIDKKDMQQAVKAGIITEKAANKLWDFWREHQKDRPSFRFSHILYYLGGMLAITAVSIYVTTAWEKMQGWPLLILSLFLMLLGFGCTHKFLQKNLRLPAGIMATFTLALVPLIVYNLQFILNFVPSRDFFYTDFHSYIDWYWVNMELATLLVGIIMFYFYRFSFLFFPIAIILWYMSMDFWPLLFPNKTYYDFQDRAVFTMIFGLIILAAAAYMDFKYENEREDYAFWLYIAGVITFWGGLSSQHSDSEFSKFIYCMINVAMLFVGAILNRRIFAVFGVLGILAYVGHLAFSVFADSLGFPIVLVFIGILIILAGVFFTRMEQRLNQMLLPYVPKKIRDRMQ